MEFRILGRLEAIERGQRLELGGSRQRALLAVLLLHRGEAVSLDRLVDELWGEHPPPTATKTIQVYVSRLRKVLGTGTLETRGRGYLLAVDPDAVDADRFDSLAAEGRRALEAGDSHRAAELLASALKLWRGPPLEEFGYDAFAQREIARLEEARLAASEDRIDAELATGRGSELVPELEMLVAQHPLRERLTAGLMVALYRAGRQSAALDAYRTLRSRLVEELGLEPGPELRELERRILQHDASLAARQRTGANRTPRRRGRRAGLAAVGLCAALATALVLTSGTAAPHKPTLGAAPGLVSIDTGSGQLVAAAPLDAPVGAVASGAGSLWVADPGSGSVLRVAPDSGAVVDRIPAGAAPGAVVSGGGAIWVASAVGATVVRIDPGTGSVTQTVTIPGSNLNAMAYARGRLWIADAVESKLFEIDPTSGSVRRTVSMDLSPSAIAIGAGKVWVTGYDTGDIEALDPASARVVARLHTGDGPVSLAFAAGALWVANNLDATVSRIDPRKRALTATISVGSGPSALAASGASLWVANQYSGTVMRIDTGANRVATSTLVGGSPTSFAMDAGRLWVGVDSDTARHHGGTLVLATTQRDASVDPAFYNGAFSPQFIGLAYDTLVTFQHSGGSSGLRLVPNLALDLPSARDGGVTYVFKLRSGIRYSDGREVKAGDFRRSFERMFRANSPGKTFFTDIVGASGCTQRRCDLAPGIVTDDSKATVAFHLTARDPDFLFKLTEQGYSAPIPPGTPDPRPGAPTPPGTGPYRIAAFTKAGVRFVRNQFFREWSHAAQPAGNPDVIVWHYMPSQQTAVTAIEQQRADWLFGLIPSAQYRQLRLLAPARVHSNPAFAVDFAPLNTHRPPFNDVRVRRALNYAIDRGKIARMYGGADYATPSCQPTAPGLPGYRRYCPYTRNPRPDGSYTAPDLALAKQLVRASGTAGERIDVWGSTDESYIPPGMPAYFADVLRSLGYRVRLHLSPLADITPAKRRKFQISVDGDWSAEYPSPSAYVPQFFGCGGGTSNGYVCERTLDREMKRAQRLASHSVGQAASQWAAVDRRISDEALWVPTVNEREIDVVSSRVHNYEYHPIWGFLADQTWL